MEMKIDNVNFEKKENETEEDRWRVRERARTHRKSNVLMHFDPKSHLVCMKLINNWKIMHSQTASAS